MVCHIPFLNTVREETRNWLTLSRLKIKWQLSTNPKASGKLAFINPNKSHPGRMVDDQPCQHGPPYVSLYKIGASVCR